jgi:NADH-quinone oxidoreductase subunit L
MIIGFLIALQAYIRNTSIRARSPRNGACCTVSSTNKWFFDELYDVIFVRPPWRSAALLEARR